MRRPYAKLLRPFVPCHLLPYDFLLTKPFLSQLLIAMVVMFDSVDSSENFNNRVIFWIWFTFCYTLVVLDLGSLDDILS